MNHYSRILPRLWNSPAPRIGPIAFAALLFLWLLTPSTARAAADGNCASCGLHINTPTIYLMKDEVTLEKVEVCARCVLEMPNCFICGLPAYTNAPGFVSLPDGRVLCGRDAKTAVLRDDEGIRLCREVQDNLGRLFSRFLALPETNVTIDIVDRVHLQELFKFAGHDYSCPNVWGITHSEGAPKHLKHRVSILSGLPVRWFQATCAHEFGHVWVAENVSEERRDAMMRSAEEGFCELNSYLFIDSLHDEAEKAHILRNAYTRGQVQLFIAAQDRYGFNDVLDWMRYGTDDRLSGDDPDRIHKVELPHGTAPARLGAPAAFAAYRTAPTTSPTNLVLQAIFWDEHRPSAIINNQTFGPNEVAKVMLGTNRVEVRCLTVLRDRVRMRIVNSGQEQELLLKRK